MHAHAYTRTATHTYIYIYIGVRGFLSPVNRRTSTKNAPQIIHKSVTTNKNKILHLINDMKKFNLDKKNLLITIDNILKNEAQ